MERHCIHIPERLGEQAILVCKKLGVLDRSYKISKRRGEILLPLTRRPTEKEERHLKCKLPVFRLGKEKFEPESKRRPKVREILEEVIPPKLLKRLPRSMPTVGNIAIIEIPEELSSFDEKIGNAILIANPSLRTVLKRAGSTSGIHRIRRFKIIAGERRTTTIHREYGCSFHLDLSKVYFNPRLAYERNRVSNLVSDGETVLDMFAGVGPFSIQIAKRKESVKIFAVDINPVAVEYLHKNIEANKVQDRIVPIEGDVERIVQEKLKGKVDRVLMNLPGSSERYINTACKALKGQGGIIHYYQFARGSNAIEEAEQKLLRGVEAAGRRVEAVMALRKVMATAPREWQIGIDALVH